MSISSRYTRAARNAWAVMLSWMPAISAFWYTHWRKILITVALAVVGVIGWSNYAERYAAQLSEGQLYLNIGRYAEAQGAFRQAVSLHPLRRIAAIANVFGDKAGQSTQQALDLLDLGSEAQWGLDKASALDTIDRTVTGQKLEQLEQRHADDADVHTLWGKYYLGLQQFSDAQKHFEAAIKLSSEATDAYFGLCGIYDAQQNNIDLALAMCEQAIAAAGSPPRPAPADYATNLAGLYAQKGRYDEALTMLNRLDNKSLSVKFELARIYQLTQHYQDAANLQQSVLQGLNDADTVNQPQNLKAWYFKDTENSIVLTQLGDKKCYVNYSLAASFYLQDTQKKAQEPLKQAAKLCPVNEEKIKKQVLFDLNLALNNGAAAGRVETFKQALLRHR